MVILAYMPQGVGFGTLRAIVCGGRAKEEDEVGRSVRAFGLRWGSINKL
jgi:hypothetical protein